MEALIIAIILGGLAWAVGTGRPAPAPPPQYTVTLSILGQGATLPEPGEYRVPGGQKMELQAIAAPGWAFSEWVEENGVVSREPAISLEVFGTVEVVAVFTQAPVLPHLKTEKGMNMAYGIKPQGWFVDGPWIAPQFYESVVAASLDGIAGLGARVVGTWLWLPSFITNIAEVVNPDFIPQWNQQTLINWERFLTLLRDRDMQLIATLSIARDQASPRDLNTIPGADIMLVDGVKPAAWGNWVSLHRDFVAMYPEQIIAAWIALKEGPITWFGDFMVDLYQTVQSTVPNSQPWAIDVQWRGYNSSEAARLKAAPGCDAWCFHDYADAQDIMVPDLTRWGDRRRWMGECGAAVLTNPDGSPDYSHLQDPAYMTPAVLKYLEVGRQVGMEAVLPWVWGARVWSMLDTNTGQFVLRPTGEAFRDWQG